MQKSCKDFRTRNFNPSHDQETCLQQVETADKCIKRGCFTKVETFPNQLIVRNWFHSTLTTAEVQPATDSIDLNLTNKIIRLQQFAAHSAGTHADLDIVLGLKAELPADSR